MPAAVRFLYFTVDEQIGVVLFRQPKETVEIIKEQRLHIICVGEGAVGEELEFLREDGW